MFNKSSKTLLIIFLGLLVLAAVFIYYDSTTEERTFERDIVKIDTSKVTSILIYPKVNGHKEVKLHKEGNYWNVLLSNNKSVSADESKIKDLLAQLLRLKVSSLAAQDESKWSEFQVDSSGTRVKVFEGNRNTLDMVIGKFAFRQPRTMVSFVRLKGDKNIYEAENFMDFAFNRNINDFRINTLISDDYSNWKKLTFSYPSDSSFQLLKDTANYWSINNVRTDSAKTIEYLRTLSNLTSNDFIDEFDQSILLKPKYTLTVESSAFGSAIIYAYVDTSKIVLHSTRNPEAYFDGIANMLWQKLFVGKSAFLKK